MEMENEKLREKNGNLQRILDSAVKERSVFEERLAEMQLVVLKKGEQQKMLREEMENKTKGLEEERLSTSNIIHAVFHIAQYI